MCKAAPHSARWLESGEILCLHFLLACGFQQLKDSKNLCKIIIEEKPGIRMWVIQLSEMKKD